MTAVTPHLIPSAIRTEKPILLSGAKRQAEMQAIEFRFADVVNSRRTLIRAAWALRRHGIICLREAASAENVQGMRAELDTLLAEIQSGEHARLDRLTYLNLPERRVLKGYNHFRDADRPVINYRVARPDGRSGSDAGMIDIFHPERLSEAFERTITASLHEDLIRRLLWISSLQRLVVKCRNVYLNHGVRDTRGYHCDGRSLKFKSFVYLSDVKDLDDGPYCFVPGSQRRRRLWWRSARYNRRSNLGPFEFSQLQGEQAIPLFANAGDMVLSCQRGAHCGHPQAPSARRAVLVNMFQR